MSSLHDNNVAGTFGTIQIAPRSGGHGVVLCVTGRNYTTDGFLAVSGAILKLPLHDAFRLHAALAEAIVAAEAAADAARQPGLWSNATVEAEAQRFVGRSA